MHTPYTVFQKYKGLSTRTAHYYAHWAQQMLDHEMYEGQGEWVVFANRFHGGHEISRHKSFLSAVRSAQRHDCGKAVGSDCTCGGVSMQWIRRDEA